MSTGFDGDGFISHAAKSNTETAEFILASTKQS